MSKLHATPAKGKRCWPLILSTMIAAFLVGGLTFYAAIVVPAASSVWGASDQGFVTRLVTWRFNAIATPCWGLFLFLNWSIRDRVLKVSLMAMLLIQACLWISHRSLDTLLDPSQHAVSDESLFYVRHQVYLWLTTAQILLGWWVVWKFCRLLSHPEPTACSLPL